MSWRHRWWITVGLIILLAAPASASEPEPASPGIPAPFVEIREVVPNVHMDMRYYTTHNFVGRPVDGYDEPKCYLTRPAARALAGVQRDLLASGLSLKIYDCYRPQRAVTDFVQWAKDLDDAKTKAEFYPEVDKKHLFRDGYIAARSGHSRGSTVDLTIVARKPRLSENYEPHENLRACTLPAGKRYGDNSLDMGTGFDCFSPLAATLSPAVGPQQRANRLLLKTLMEKHGFVNYDKEWWHYTLRNEPFPDAYFDFPIR